MRKIFSALGLAVIILLTAGSSFALDRVVIGELFTNTS